MCKKILFLLVLLTAGFRVFSQDIPPKSNTLVTDYTNSLDADDKASLENKLVAFNDSSSTQIAVVLMHSIGDNDIAEYGVKLGRAWGIGQKGKNNGILLLAAMDQHKVTIQVAYGLEGALPDAIASEIIEKDIKPNFKQKAYFDGLSTATDDIIKYTRGEYKADAKSQTKGNDGGSGGVIPGIIIFIIVFLVIIFRNRGGGGGHIIGGRGGASPFWWFVAGDILGSSGRGGSSWGGGSSGSSGGGFGGFGGGSFGGGGASGSW